MSNNYVVQNCLSYQMVCVVRLQKHFGMSYAYFLNGMASWNMMGNGIESKIN